MRFERKDHLRGSVSRKKYEAIVKYSKFSVLSITI